MNQASTSSDRRLYYELASSPPEHLCWEVATRAKRLRRISDDLDALYSPRRERFLVVEIVVLLVFSIGLVVLAVVPLGVDTVAFGSRTVAGFPSGMSAFAMVLAPVSLYALHTVYRSYRRLEVRRHAIRRFQEHARNLIEDAAALSAQIQTQAQK